MNEDFNLATADQHELRFYAKQLEPSLELHHSLGAAKMRDRIVAHCEANSLATPEASVGNQHADDKDNWITINVAKQEGKGGAEPAFVGVQGRSYAIPRGIAVSVPPSVVGVLNNAKKDIVTQDPDTGEIHTETVLTYPFQIIYDPSASRPAA